MQYKRKIRCPLCDGEIHLNKNNNSYYNEKGDWVSRYHQMPICSDCKTVWKIAFTQDGELKMTFEMGAE